jgi:hypothetical protein
MPIKGFTDYLNSLAEAAEQEQSNEAAPASLQELSAKTLRSYVHKATLDNNLRYNDMNKSTGSKLNRLADKYIKREEGIQKAEAKLKPRAVKEDTELSNVVDNSGQEDIIERNYIDPAQYLTVRNRVTKGADVVKRHTQRERGMYHTTRTNDAIDQDFRKAGRKSDHLTDKKGHNLTNRWADERRARISRLRKPSYMKEENLDENAYIEAKQQLHMAHHEAGRQLAGMERDPELRRIDLHRAKKHLHAHRALDILKAQLNKKQQ